jgi:hypothetical protein
MMWYLKLVEKEVLPKDTQKINKKALAYARA